MLVYMHDTCPSFVRYTACVKEDVPGTEMLTKHIYVLMHM